jgi:myo-inositol-1(or 4)-monophosphatase
MRPELDRVVEEVQRLAGEAGELLLSLHGEVSPETAGRKGQRSLVTVADLRSEELIRSGLERAFPGVPILGEEQGGEERRAGLLWIVDPLDGTTNFAHRLPMWAVSIALVEDADPVVGVIEAPLQGERFHGVRGGGAFLGEAPLRVSSTRALGDALVATGFAYERHRLPASNTSNHTRMVMACRDVRRCGAAALDLAYVAAGRLDGFWELYLSPWDLAAGTLLVREAGGEVSDLDGGPGWLFGESLVATNGLLHAAFLATLDLT